MLMRISLIVAILAALAAGGLGYYEVTNQIPALTQQRDQEHTAKQQALTELASTKKDLATTKKDLAQTQQDLASAKEARKKAEDAAAAQTKRADDLADKLAKTTQERDTAQADLAAYKATEKTPKEILQLVDLIKKDQDTINAINEEKKVLSRSNNRLQNQLDLLLGKGPVVVKLRADLKGKVVVVDPKWDFVVLNIGDDQGVLENGELLVSRDGRLVAKVIVRTVEKDRSIANVVPGWKLGDIFEGDTVTPAHPAS
jgi:HD superfamily phosphohydrolase